MQFQTDTVAAMSSFKKAGVSRLLIDLTNNGGMCFFYSGKQVIYKSWNFIRWLRVPGSVPPSIPRWRTDRLPVSTPRATLSCNAYELITYRSGFQSTTRGNTLAQKIVKNDIAMNITQLFYSPVDCKSSLNKMWKW